MVDSPPHVLLERIRLHEPDAVRGYLHLPEKIPGAPNVSVTWFSSHPEIVSARKCNGVAPGVVRRPDADAGPVQVKLTAQIDTACEQAEREFAVTVQPAVRQAVPSRYAMVNFAQSHSHEGQQNFFAASRGNDPTSGQEVNAGRAVLRSTKGMHAVRDPSIVRSPEGDRFFLIATDLNVGGDKFGWRGWDWAQSGASRYIEVWESDDLSRWSRQRHVLVAPEEAGMVFAPEAVWVPELGSYLVTWTSSLYETGTSYNPEGTGGRSPLTRNVTMCSTTRDFVTFSPAQVISGRPGHGTLDALIVRDDLSGDYHRFVCDRISTGVDVRPYAAPDSGDDIYQERASHPLAPADQWEVVAPAITRRAMGARYAEAPMVVRANPGDPRGGFYLWADQQWSESPAGGDFEQQLSPYWAPTLNSGAWEPLPWEPPAYEGSRGVMRHGCVIGITVLEHASLRGVQPSRISIHQPPLRCSYTAGDRVDLEGLRVFVEYDGVPGSEEILRGRGGYDVVDPGPLRSGSHEIEVRVNWAGVQLTTSFPVAVREAGPLVEGSG